MYFAFGCVIWNEGPGKKNRPKNGGGGGGGGLPIIALEKKLKSS